MDFLDFIHQHQELLFHIENENYKEASDLLKIEWLNALSVKDFDTLRRIVEHIERHDIDIHAPEWFATLMQLPFFLLMLEQDIDYSELRSDIVHAYMRKQIDHFNQYPEIVEHFSYYCHGRLIKLFMHPEEEGLNVADMHVWIDTLYPVIRGSDFEEALIFHLLESYEDDAYNGNVFYQHMPWRLFLEDFWWDDLPTEQQGPALLAHAEFQKNIQTMRYVEWPRFQHFMTIFHDMLEGLYETRAVVSECDLHL